MAYKIRWSQVALEDRVSILSYMLEAGADTEAILRLDTSILRVSLNKRHVSRGTAQNPEKRAWFVTSPFTPIEQIQFEWKQKTRTRKKALSE